MDEARSSASRPTPLGIYDRHQAPRITGIEITAAIVSALWLIGAAIILVTLPDGPDGWGVDSVRLMITALAVFMPIAMVWVAATAARSARVMREESQRLQAAMDAIRQAYITQSQSGGKTPDSGISRKLDEIAAATRRTETALATLAEAHAADERQPTQPEVSSAAPVTEEQHVLALGTPSAGSETPLASADFIRALNFPDTAEDKEGFSALRRALRDRSAGQIIQAAQDVLTLLSQEGIYMDDLRPDRARPEIWRDFAKGVRGKAVSGLGGIRDQSSLALASGRMKKDPIFRDAAHHFLRKFDRSFAAFEPGATDADISALADTRTARAFMLLGRAAGTFD